MGCALPVLETPACLTSYKPKYLKRLCGSFIWVCWYLWAWLSPEQKTRWVARAAKRVGWVAVHGEEGWTLSSWLKCCCQCWLAGWHVIALVVWMTGWAWHAWMVLRKVREPGGLLWTHHHWLYWEQHRHSTAKHGWSLLFTTSALSWLIQPCQAWQTHTGSPPKSTWAPWLKLHSSYVHIHTFKCQFLYFHNLKVPFCPADIYTMFIGYSSERTQQTKLDS